MQIARRDYAAASDRPSAEPAMKVGFIGLGIMGAPMALNILKRGHDLVVYNRTAAKARPLTEAGATLATTPQDISDVDVLFTVVSDGPAEEAMLFDTGLIDRLPRQCVHVSTSTVGVATTRRLAAAHRERGRPYVAAPVVGRAIDMAPAGKLFVIAAGPADSLARCAPLFAAVGQRTFEFGADPAAATAVKLATNFLTAAALEAMGEAFALSGQYGVRGADFYEFITGTLYSCIPYRTFGKLIEEDRYVPANFVVPLGLKDVKLALDAGEQVGLAMPAANVVRDHFVQAIAQGYADEDWSVIARVIANGVSRPRQ
jgi:3-hydroxyisobutyrate dehydrogenase-like beta-hydroxyacid dehydrogenase